jgi:hypothetical protein
LIYCPTNDNQGNFPKKMALLSPPLATVFPARSLQMVVSSNLTQKRLQAVAETFAHPAE